MLILTASTLENWKRPPSGPQITWMKTVLDDQVVQADTDWSSQHTWKPATLKAAGYEQH